MKYTKVRITWGPSASDKITFVLNNILPTDKYVCESIVGLEPPPIDLAIVDRVYEGGVSQGRRPTNREIIMMISFQPDYSVGEDPGALRKKLYLMLSPRGNTDVIFQLLTPDETQSVRTTGQIKRMEANPFSADPQVQITMSCLSAYFAEPEFVHPSPVTLSGLANIPVTNDGDVNVGFYINHVLTAAINPYIFTLNGKFIRLNYAFLANDRIFINTNPGARRVERWRSGQSALNLLPYFTADSTWLSLEPGTNLLDPNTNSYTVDEFKYTPKHWGF